MSAWRATSGSVLRGPAPPMSIGSRAWTGRGSQTASCIRYHRPVVGHALAVEQPADEPDGLAQAVEPLAEPAPEVDPEGVVLALEPAAAEAEDGATAAQVVHGRGQLGGEPRVAERVRRDQEADPRPARDRRDRGQGRPALQLAVAPVALVGEQVIVEPEVVEPGRLGADHGVAQLRPPGPLDPERRAEAHRHPPPPRPYRTVVPAAQPSPSRSATPSSRGTAPTGAGSAFRATSDPYAVLVSELMAQQTQAERAAAAWTRVDGPLPDGRVAGRCAGRRRRPGVGGARLQPAGREPPASGHGDRRAARRPGAGHGGGPRRAARRRPVHRSGRGRDRVRAPGGRRGYQRPAGPRPRGRGRSVVAAGRRAPGPRRRRGPGRTGRRLDPRPDGPRRARLPAADAAVRRVPGPLLVPLRGG